LRHKFVGEKLLDSGYYSITKPLYELLAKRLAFEVVGVLGLSSMFLVEECFFLAIHAQRGNFGKVDLIPAVRAHKRLCEVELRSEAREHQTVLGANVVPRDIDRPVEHDLANFLVGPQGLAVLSPSDGAYFAHSEISGVRLSSSAVSNSSKSLPS
jgi:hypothetical protein